jgi:protein arginine kinase activator
MKMCEECGANPANVHLTQIVNNDAMVMNLCDECAKKKGINISIEDGGGKDKNPDDEKYKDMKCPRCGLPYLEFKTKGWLGCAGCYSAFEKEIDELLVRVHGSSVHRGKRYARCEPAGKRGASLKQLKRDLEAAIRNEQFELAAEIRDEIHSMSDGKGEGK